MLEMALAIIVASLPGLKEVLSRETRASIASSMATLEPERDKVSVELGQV
jgi:hypothetical protein